MSKPNPVRSVTGLFRSKDVTCGLSDRKSTRMLRDSIVTPITESRPDRRTSPKRFPSYDRTWSTWSAVGNRLGLVKRNSDPPTDSSGPISLYRTSGCGLARSLDRDHAAARGSFLLRSRFSAKWFRHDSVTIPLQAGVTVTVITESRRNLLSRSRRKTENASGVRGGTVTRS